MRDFSKFLIKNLFFSFSKANTYRKMSTYRKAFVRHLEAEDTLKINFSFGTAEFTEKNFGFVRSKNEKLETTLARMQLKILDAMTKKLSKKKKRAVTDDNETNSLPNITIELFNKEDLVSNSENCFNAWTLSTELKINEVVYQIIQNPPTVLQISLPRSVMAGFPIYPKIGLEFCSKEHCQFNWFRSISKNSIETCYRDDIVKIKGESWLPICQSFIYVIQKSDIGCRLKLTCLPKCEDKTGVEESAISPDIVQPGPKRCPFEDRHEYTKEVTKTGSLRCVSYNILADLYADTDTARNDLFPYCPIDALMVDYRKQLYLKEIIGYNGDIICLQEVDRKIFSDDLLPVLSATGLEGLYNEKGGRVVEGLACFYRASKFKLIESHSIILSEAFPTEPVLQKMYSKINENEKLKQKIMSRTTALQVILLESTDVPKKRVLVGNTHLYFHPKSDNIRLIQGSSCILYLESLLLKYRQQDPSYTTGLIFSGDFNSSPDCGIYQLITSRHLKNTFKDWNSNPEEFVPGLALEHSLSMASACGIPDYTNYTEGFVGCLDYIYYDASTFKVCDVVPFPKHEQVIKNRAIPSIEFPSDHLALISTLEWK